MQIPLPSTERSQMLETFQLGAEGASTPGLQVAADIKPRSFEAQLKMESSVESYPISGSRFYGRYLQGEEYTTGSYSGYMTYTEDYLIYDSVFGKATPTTVGTAGKKRVYAPSEDAPITPQTYTFEAGQASRGEAYACGFFNGIKMSINKKTAKKSGPLMAQALQDNQTLTASPSLIGIKEVFSKTCYVKSATAYSGLAGATKLRRNFELDFEYSGAFVALMPIVDDNIAFDGLAEQMPTQNFSITASKTAEGMANLPKLRAGDVVYWEFGAVGPVIDTVSHSLKVQLATQISKGMDTGTTQAVASATWSFAPVPVADTVPLKIELVNTIT